MAQKQKRRFVPASDGELLLSRIKVIFFGVLSAAVLVALEGTWIFALNTKLLGYASPYLALPFVIAVGFFMGEHEGAIAGLFTGFLFDSASTRALMLSPLLFFACGYLAGYLADKILAHNLPSYMINSAVGTAFVFTVLILSDALMGADIPLFDVLLHGFLKTAVTVLFSIPIYLLVRLYCVGSIKKKR